MFPPKGPPYGQQPPYGGQQSYGGQIVGGLGGKGPDSLPTLPTSLSQSSKFSSGPAGSNLARPNDDYMAVRGYAQKLDQYGTDYTSERRLYGEHSANIGKRDGLTDLDRRYPDHIPAGHQIHGRVEQCSAMRHQPLLKAQLPPVSDMRSIREQIRSFITTKSGKTWRST